VHGVQCTLLFFTAIHSPITQCQITDYAYGTKRSIFFPMTSVSM